MDRAATGSWPAAERMAESSAAVAFVGATSSRAPGRPGKRLEQHDMGSRIAQLVGQVGLHQGASPAGRELAGDGGQGQWQFDPRGGGTARRRRPVRRRPACRPPSDGRRGGSEVGVRSARRSEPLGCARCACRTVSRPANPANPRSTGHVCQRAQSWRAQPPVLHRRGPGGVGGLTRRAGRAAGPGPSSCESRSC